jgi:hypothetical protein
MRAYDFWTETGHAEAGPFPAAALSLRPSSDPRANDLEMLFPSNMPVDKQLAETHTVYRAGHDSIVMGRYTTADAARQHSEQPPAAPPQPEQPLVADSTGQWRAARQPGSGATS